MNSSNGFPPDFEASEIEIIHAVEPYTMTSTERIHALIGAVRHIVRNRIPGAMVECGVWKGGSVMAMALALLQLGERDRSLYLFDTFSGMTPPSAGDVDYQGQQAVTILDDVRCEASQQEVENVVFSTGYDRARIHFVKGTVEETIPAHAPELISLLRLDTDWYESTQHELSHLFPRLARGGVIIIDDYGHWRGARQAVDEYLAQQQIPLLLHRIDYTGRIGVKI
jgi:O-methyltransferase